SRGPLPLRHEHRLSTSGGTVDQRQRSPKARRDSVDQALADDEARKAGDCKLGPQQRTNEITAWDRHSSVTAEDQRGGLLGSAHFLGAPVAASERSFDVALEVQGCLLTGEVQLA